ncbi:MAG: 30S ribosomal protein S21 [Bacteroidetes bacterium]|nr:30S ribosomal protein S21 [Bacteroidota bacterium]
MLHVQIKEGEGVEKALKKLKKKFEKTGILRELRSRQVFTKPSIKRREIIKRAKHRQRQAQSEE